MFTNGHGKMFLSYIKKKIINRTQINLLERHFSLSLHFHILGKNEKMKKKVLKKKLLRHLLKLKFHHLHLKIKNT